MSINHVAHLTELVKIAVERSVLAEPEESYMAALKEFAENYDFCPFLPSDKTAIHSFGLSHENKFNVCLIGLSDPAYVWIEYSDGKITPTGYTSQGNPIDTNHLGSYFSYGATGISLTRLVEQYKPGPMGGDRWYGPDTDLALLVSRRGISVQNPGRDDSAQIETIQSLFGLNPDVSLFSLSAWRADTKRKTQDYIESQLFHRNPPPPYLKHLIGMVSFSSSILKDFNDIPHGEPQALHTPKDNNPYHYSIASPSLSVSTLRNLSSSRWDNSLLPPSFAPELARKIASNGHWQSFRIDNMQLPDADAIHNPLKEQFNPDAEENTCPIE